jgi:hypothetical protein
MVASGICQTWMNTMLGLLFGAAGSPYTAPGTIYIGICTSVAGDTGAITSEATGGSYARKSMTNDTNTWNTAAAGVVTNKAAVTFVTADGSWGGSKASFFVSDHATLGTTHTIGYGTLAVAKDVTSGDTCSFAAGALSISFTATT